MTVVNVKDQEFYIDGYLKKNLDYVIPKVLEKKNMAVTIVDGRVGTGKSTFVSQLAYYCSDGKFDVVHECFTPEQFHDALRSATKGDAIVLDEAFELLNKRKTQSTSNMMVLSLIQQMRAKQVFIFIVLPSMYDLDKNLVLNICDLFLHCYRKDFGMRGQFTCYDRIRMKQLWLNCRQSYSYNSKIARPNFRGRFSSHFPIDYDAYEKKKMKALEGMAKEQEEGGSKYHQHRDRLVSKLKETGVHVKEIASTLDISQKSVYNILTKMSKLKE